MISLVLPIVLTQVSGGAAYTGSSSTRSDAGHILALRDDESRCSYLGLDTARWRIALLVACGVVAALAGFGYGAFSGVVAPELTGFVFGTG